MKATLLTAAALATCALAAAPANAAITFTGTTSGCFGVSCSPTTPATDAGLTFTGSTGFSATTDTSGFASVSGNSTQNLGSFSLDTAAHSYAGDLFTLLVTFTAPPGSGSGTFSATLKGAVTSNPLGGGVSIDFDNTAQSIAYSGGTFTLLVHDLSVGPGGTSFISGDLQAVPEPATWAMMLLGFGGIGLAMRRRRRPALAQVA